MTIGDLRLRAASNDDSQDLFGLLSLCFADYPGCFVDPHEDLTDLRSPAQSFAKNGGALQPARARQQTIAARDIRPDRFRRFGAGITIGISL